MAEGWRQRIVKGEHNLEKMRVTMGSGSYQIRKLVNAVSDVSSKERWY